jgi:hypothetical protein
MDVRVGDNPYYVLRLEPTRDDFIIVQVTNLN